MNRLTPRHLLHYVIWRLRLRGYLKDPGDGRPQPQIPAQALLWASFLAVEALVRSSARRTLRIATSCCDDTLGYFTERLDPHPTRQALLSLLRGAKRNKAFDDCRWIGLAIDGTGAGWRTQANDSTAHGTSTVANTGCTTAPSCCCSCGSVFPGRVLPTPVDAQQKKLDVPFFCIPPRQELNEAANYT